MVFGMWRSSARLEVDVAGLATEHGLGAYVLDVREPFEFVEAHVPGARLVPMGELPAHLAEIPRDRRVLVICASGHRSLTAARWLQRQGIDAVSVAGGTNAWAASGRHVERGHA
jgi:rhodanese-related sulfurtransferase